MLIEVSPRKPEYFTAPESGGESHDNGRKHRCIFRRPHVGNWAVVLGVLADDVFESVVDLLNRNRIRGGNMLSRALEDYDVRLRYYIVQSMKVLAKYKTKGITSPKNTRNIIRAGGRTEFRVNVPALPRKRGSEIGAA